MRLLHVDSLLIRDFTGRKVPPYAILSHTWGEEEVSFKDMTKGRAPGLKGYEKIQACCRQAQIDCLEYVWIDTCCIDKRSSAELSEAINSMYCWYTKAQVCYAYLGDVTWPSGSKLDNTTMDQGLPPSFLSSRWFSRGWTLQELIAPPVVIFYSSEWSEIGSRKALRNTLMELTGISYDAFEGFVDRCSVAQKMSWASKRETTRVEDEAYCMLGLFGVSMPLLYGEGRKAFRRLQEEIIKRSDDETIFAWARGNDDGRLLALSPSNFEAFGCFECSDIRGGDFYSQSAWNSSPFTVTNKGVQLSLPVIEYQPLNLLPGLLCGQRIREYERNRVCSLAVLNCHEIARKDEYVAILLDRKKGLVLPILDVGII
ncbi:HET-domain-containing protein [Ustulina deusta]|nr:HET-domain-containing protein [Ustulina deusta]